jgi:proton glutamate symport protein
MKKHLHWLIFGGMLAGALVGMAMWGMDASSSLRSGLMGLFDFFGKTIFVGSLKMIVAPLIFFSIISAIVSLPTAGELWKIGSKAMIFYLITTSVAVSLGLGFVLVMQPGMKGQRDSIRANWSETKKDLHNEFADKDDKITAARDMSTSATIKRNVEMMILNPFKALAEAKSLGIIFFAILLGVALIAIGTAGKPVIPVMQGLNTAIMKLTGWIMAGSPIFIFCLIASLVGTQGPAVFKLLAWYVATVLVAIAAHLAFLMVVLRVWGKMDPITFFKGIGKAWMLSFSTRSSAATLPVTMECLKKDLKVSPKVADFVLPLGATVNMDGTALYEGVAVIFLIQLFGGMPGAEITLTPVVTLLIFLTAVLASIGAAAVPDAGLVTMVLVATAVGLSVEYIPIIFAVDAFLDMFRTSTNVVGDSVGAVVINRLEKKRLA